MKLFDNDLFLVALILILVFSCAYFAILPFASKINELITKYTVGERDKIHGKLEDIFISISQQKLLNILLIFTLSCGLISFLLCIPNFAIGLILFPISTVICWFIPGLVLNFYIKKRTEKFNVQLVDALSLMSSGLRAGQSISQAIETVVREMNNPVKEEFELVLRQTRIGLSIEDALEQLSTRLKSDECLMLVTSITILYSTGASLSETFDTISQTIRERIKLEQKIQAMTSMGRFQGGFILSLPPLILLMNYSTDPAGVTLMFQKPLGLLLMIVSFVLFVLGGFVLWKITQIRV